MNTTSRYTAIAALILSFSVSAAPVSAAESSNDSLALPVTFKDLDLTRAAGAQTLYLRIKSAAAVVCAPLDGKRLIEKRNRGSCVANAMQRAVKQVNEPMLTRHFLALNPKSDVAAVLAVKR